MNYFEKLKIEVMIYIINPLLNLNFLIREFLLVLSKSLFIFINPNYYIRKFDIDVITKNYSLNSSLETLVKNKLLNIIREITNIYGKNLFKRNLSGNIELSKKYFFNSKAFDQVRWVKHTFFGIYLNERNISNYYKSSKSLYYSQVEKLADKSSIECRLSQFKFINLSKINEKSYIEIGGSTGLLPLIAADLGFEIAINYEPSAVLSKEGLTIAKNLCLSNYLAVNKLPDDTKYDIISCHQVLEHILEPIKFLQIICSIMHNETELFLSHSLELFPYPGHIKHNVSFDSMLCNAGLKILDFKKNHGNLYTIVRK